MTSSVARSWRPRRSAEDTASVTRYTVVSGRYSGGFGLLVALAEATGAAAAAPPSTSMDSPAPAAAAAGSSTGGDGSLIWVRGWEEDEVSAELTESDHTESDQVLIP